MDNEKQILAIRDNAKSELMSLKTIEDGMIQVNKLKGIETWVRAQKLDSELQVIVKEQQLRTQRIVGQLLKEGKESGDIDAGMGGNRKITVPEVNREKPKTLTDLGLSKKQSANFQKLAAIPEEVFEDHISEAKKEVETAVNKLTTTGALKLAEVIDDKKEAMQAAQEIGQKIEHEKTANDLIKKINALPVLYRLKIKQAIK